MAYFSHSNCGLAFIEKELYHLIRALQAKFDFAVNLSLIIDKKGFEEAKKYAITLRDLSQTFVIMHLRLQIKEQIPLKNFPKQQVLS